MYLVAEAVLSIIIHLQGIGLSDNSKGGFHEPHNHSGSTDGIA